MSPEESIKQVGIIFPVGMIGMGFPIDLIEVGIEMGATAIAVDGGSTDSGPHYLGTGTPKSSAAGVERDLRVMLVAGRRAGIPVIVGSCGTAGTNSGVDWMAGLADRIAKEESLSLRVARIYSELTADSLVSALEAGNVGPLPPAPPLDSETIRSCEHIVGLMGHEPIVDALSAGANVVLAGRATDTAMVAAVALMNGLPAGPAWHAAKTVECGGLCTTNPRATGTSSPVFVSIDEKGFTVTPLHPDAACTPETVAGHMLYENANPFRLTEPSGVLDTSEAFYMAIDDRTVRVEGSRFEESGRRTMKIEGSRRIGYETISFVGIADPHILANIGTWVERVRTVLTDRVKTILGLDPTEYQVDLRCYGWNGVLGDVTPVQESTPAEVGVLFKVRAANQQDATAIAKTANPLLLHQPLPDMVYAPSFAFATSPAEIERGAVYEFALNHVINMKDNDYFQTYIEALDYA